MRTALSVRLGQLRAVSIFERVWYGLAITSANGLEVIPERLAVQRGTREHPSGSKIFDYAISR